jgi:hypothetical protein
MLASGWLSRYATHLPSRLRYTVGGGVVLAAIFSLIASAQFILGGGSAFRGIGVPFWAVVSGYLVMGVAAGFIVGLLWPAARWWPGALVVGYVAVVPVWFIAGLELGSPVRESARSALVLSLAFGPALGFYSWYLVRKQSR